MKKALLTLFLMLCVAVTGCEGNNSSNVNSMTENTTIAESTPPSEKTESISSDITQSKEETTDNTEITSEDNMSENVFYITANGTTFTADLENNKSAEAFKQLLKEKPLVVEMSDYGNFEKVGNIGTSLPRTDTQITTTPGDVILYQGNSVTVYYDKNSWNFTKLGKIRNATKEGLLEVLGKGDVTVTFSLE